MAKDWIETLAEDIRRRNRDAALEYGRAQHFAGIISAQGKQYFVALVLCLQDDIETLRRQLQGDAVASDTALQTIKPDEVRITRARFPWVDARLIHQDETITLDYAKGPGSEEDPALDRKTRSFAFHVGSDGTVVVQDAFAEPSQNYRKPEELARSIVELLFGA
jgi:hypothetical protein